MPDTTALIAIVLAFFVITVSPGPATLANASVAMSHGRKAGLKFALGLSIGLMFWGLIAASGMGMVLQQSVYVLTALKVLGGLYLLWLAFGSARSACQADPNHAAFQTKDKRWIFRGLVLNLSNPQAVLAWMAALSVGMSAQSSVYALGTALALCLVATLAVYAAYTLMFSVGGVMRAYRRFRRWIDGFVAGLFALAGVALIGSVLRR